MRVQVLDMAGAPVAGARVQVRPIRRRATGQTRTADVHGITLHTLPVRDDLEIVVDGLGITTATSELRVGPTLRDTTVTVRTTVVPIRLQPLFAEGQSRCGRRSPADAAELVRRYEVMTHSLLRVMAAQDSFEYVGQLVHESRIPIPLRDMRVRPIRDTRTDTVMVRTPAPLAAPGPDSLLLLGFAIPREGSGGVRYYPPTPELMTSTAFYHAHCFNLAEDTATGLVGLAFERSRSSDNVDIRGSIWMDTATAAVTRVQFLYQNVRGVLHYELPEFQDETYERYGRRDIRFRIADSNLDQFGGELQFGKVAGGTPTIVAWTIRVPRLEHYKSATGRDGTQVTAEPLALHRWYRLLAVSPRK